MDSEAQIISSDTFMSRFLARWSFAVPFRWRKTKEESAGALQQTTS
jgi:hypothetical protein